MLALLIGSIGFICCFIYDYNSIRLNNRFLQSFFGVGSILIIISTVLIILKHHPQTEHLTLISIMFALIALFFLILLIYTLFFALPFDETYIKENHPRKAYTKGVYALCRHPGVLWFAGFYICISISMVSLTALTISLFLILWNILYILYQDKIIFPMTFDNYKEYCLVTPFLIPTKNSISLCFKSHQRKGGAAH